MIPVFIGYDSREPVAYHVLAHSLLQRSSEPLAITPVGNTVLPDRYWWREKGPHDSTEFSNARFIIPALMNYKGWAIFMDCDMIGMGDIAKLWAQRDERYPVMVVKHSHRPGEDRKFLGAEQARYYAKNWSSLMLLNCGHPMTRGLTPEYVNIANGLDLHQFAWCGAEPVGELHGAWNVLVAQGFQHPEPVDPFGIQLLHYTLGGPWHGYADEGWLMWAHGLRELLAGQNPCADVVIHQAEPGTMRFSGRYQRRDEP